MEEDDGDENLILVSMYLAVSTPSGPHPTMVHFTLANGRRFYSSKGDVLDRKEAKLIKDTI